MKKEHIELRTLIDNHNAASLRAFLTTHPDLDLNNISQNGASALWWALTPPQGTSVSQEIIQALIESNRIDPTIKFNNLRWNDIYLSDEINQSIRQYENQYVRLVHRQVQQEARLANLVADKQNTHDSTIVTAIDQSKRNYYNEISRTLSGSTDYSRNYESSII